VDLKSLPPREKQGVMYSAQIQLLFKERAFYVRPMGDAIAQQAVKNREGAE